MRRISASSGGRSTPTAACASGPRATRSSACFPEAGAAVAAAIDAQRALTAARLAGRRRVRVRMGLHSGEAHLAGDDYGGFEVNRAARIAAAGHGGQVVLSEPTRLLAEAVLDRRRRRPRSRPTRPARRARSRSGSSSSTSRDCATDFPPLRTSRPAEGNLPLRMTSFLGRDRELRELAELLQAQPARHADRARRDRQDEPRGRAGAAQRRRPSPTAPGSSPLDVVDDPSQVCRLSRARSACSTGRSGRRPIACRSTWPGGRSSSSSTTSSTCSTRPEAVSVLLRASPGVRIVVTSRAPLRRDRRTGVPRRSRWASAGLMAAPPSSSSSGRVRSALAGTPGPNGRPSRRSADCSTGCRSVWSSPPRGSRCFRSSPSATGSPVVWRCQDPARATCPRGNGRSRGRSAGATTSWSPGSSGSCRTCPSSTAASTSTQAGPGGGRSGSRLRRISSTGSRILADQSLVTRVAGSRRASRPVQAAPDHPNVRARKARRERARRRSPQAPRARLPRPAPRGRALPPGPRPTEMARPTGRRPGQRASSNALVDRRG